MKRWSGVIILVGLAAVPVPGSAFVPTPADLNRALALAQAGLQNGEAQLKPYFPFRAFDNPAAPVATLLTLLLTTIALIRPALIVSRPSMTGAPGN